MPKNNQCCIYMVPKKLRKVKEEAYTSQGNNPWLEDILSKLRLEEENENDYILSKQWLEEENENDYILSKQWLEEGIKHDLRLLENQPPLFILDDLYSRGGDKDFITRSPQFQGIIH